MPERRDRNPAASSPPTSSLAASREDSHGPGARPERDPPLDRGAADAGQRGRFLGEWVDVGGVIDVESAAREETLDAPVDGGEQPCHLLVARRLGGVELEAPVFSRGEDAVQQEGVEVDVQLEAAPEALRLDTVKSGSRILVACPSPSHGNGAPIGGLKVATANGWFAARPSGTEDVYKIYAESFVGREHLARIQDEARALVAAVLAR